MAKAAAGPAGMDKADLRKHIVFARKSEVHVAFALGGDGKAIMMMDKRKQPRAIEKELKEQAADSKNHRFGTLSFLPDRPTVARFVINKPASGMARKLVVALKGTGVREIEIVLEDGTAVEQAQGEDDEEADDGDAGGGLAGAARGLGNALEGAAKSVEGTLTGAVDGLAQGIEGLFGGGGGEEEHHRRHRHREHRERRVESGDAAVADDSVDSGGADAPDSSATTDATPDDGSQLDGSADGAQADGMQADSAADGPTANDPGTDDTDANNAGADASAPDGKALAATLTGLVKRMMGVIANDPRQKSALVEMATDAQASLKGGDLRQASAAIDIFQQALDSASSAVPSDGDQSGTPDPAPTPASDPAAAAPGAAVVQRYKKSRAVWVATRAKVDSDIAKLRKRIMSIDHEGTFGDDLEQQFLSSVDPVLSTLDDSLADLLDQAAQATDGGAATKLTTQARATIGRYQKFVAANETIRDLDSNPFVPMAIAKTLEASLTALVASLR